LQFFSRDFDFEKSEENQYPKETPRMVTRGCYAEKPIARGEPSVRPALALHVNCGYGVRFNPSSISLRALSLASPWRCWILPSGLGALFVDLCRVVIGEFA
jgi:hypothetical protein